MNEYLQMKWVLWNEIRRVFAFPYIWMYFFINRVRWGQRWRILGTPIIQRYKNSQIHLGDRLILRSWVSTNPVAPNHPVFLSTRTNHAKIIIGDDFGITGGSIIAAKCVEIGNRVIIGGNCLITDTDFHPLESRKRMSKDASITAVPVFIDDDVFIGTNSILLKGVNIGKGSVIGAGSVVTGDIPANVIAAGNPAVVISSLA